MPWLVLRAVVRDVHDALSSNFQFPYLFFFFFVLSFFLHTNYPGNTYIGKSTILSLVERFYDPSAGSITLDGVDIKL